MDERAVGDGDLSVRMTKLEEAVASAAAQVRRLRRRSTIAVLVAALAALLTLGAIRRVDAPPAATTGAHGGTMDRAEMATVRAEDAARRAESAAARVEAAATRAEVAAQKTEQMFVKLQRE